MALPYLTGTHLILSPATSCLQLRNKWKSLTQRELNNAYEGPVFELADKCGGACSPFPKFPCLSLPSCL